MKEEGEGQQHHNQTLISRAKTPPGPFGVNERFTFTNSSFLLQVARPVTLKKDGIQTRNRKLQGKTKKAETRFRTRETKPRASWTRRTRPSPPRRQQQPQPRPDTCFWTQPSCGNPNLYGNPLWHLFETKHFQIYTRYAFLVTLFAQFLDAINMAPLKYHL